MTPVTPQRGAALLAAMLTVTLVATLAATAMWQQWRAIEMESAERARGQSAWILSGALQWSRLILREDGRSGGADHLGEPWAVPLQEARLSTFLAADRNVAQIEDASTPVEQAFLSGQMMDLQSRLNLTNLVEGGRTDPRALRQFQRLFDRLGLPQQELALMVEGLRQSALPDTSASGPAAPTTATQAPLLPPSMAQLGWLGVSPATQQRLQEHVTLLPTRQPLNLNTAGEDALWAALEGIDSASVRKIMQTRQTRHFRTLAEVTALLPTSVEVNGTDHAIASRYFEVRGRLRLGNNIVEEVSVLDRRGIEVRTVSRYRENAVLATASAPAAAIR